MNQDTQYIIALCNLYGLVHKDKVIEIYNLHHQNKITELTYNEQELLTHFTYVEGDYFVQDSIIDFDEFDYYMDEKQGKPYYIPPKEKLLLYVDNLYFEKNNEFRALTRYIHKHFFPNDSKKAFSLADDLQLECEHKMNPKYLYQVINRYGVVFNSEEQIQEFIQLIVDLGNNTRSWENNGHTPKELFELGVSDLLTTPHYRSRMEPEAETKVKVGRNDPCPCGSGKKYKKCCLN